MVRTFEQVHFFPRDDTLPGRLPFRTLRYFNASARNLVGVNTVPAEQAEPKPLPTRWPVRAFELWGRTARLSATDQQVANCAVAVLDRVVPELVVSRPLREASELLVSGADESFTTLVMHDSMTELLRQLPPGGQVAIEDRFVLVSELPGSPTGLRSLAERCLLLVDNITPVALEGWPEAVRTDPLVPILGSSTVSAE